MAGEVVEGGRAVECSGGGWQGRRREAYNLVCFAHVQTKALTYIYRQKFHYIVVTRLPGPLFTKNK